jgi:hypothetical protein
VYSMLAVVAAVAAVAAHSWAVAGRYKPSQAPSSSSTDLQMPVEAH